MSEYCAPDSGHAIAYPAIICLRFRAYYSDLGMACPRFRAYYSNLGMASPRFRADFSDLGMVK